MDRRSSALGSSSSHVEGNQLDARGIWEDLCVAVSVRHGGHLHAEGQADMRVVLIAGGCMEGTEEPLVGNGKWVEQAEWVALRIL